MNDSRDFNRFIAEHRMFHEDSEASHFLGRLGVATVRYFGNPKMYDDHIQDAFASNPESNLVLLDGYRILVADELV